MSSLPSGEYLHLEQRIYDLITAEIDRGHRPTQIYVGQEEAALLLSCWPGRTGTIMFDGGRMRVLDLPVYTVDDDYHLAVV